MSIKNYLEERLQEINNMGDDMGKELRKNEVLRALIMEKHNDKNLLI